MLSATFRPQIDDVLGVFLSDAPELRDNFSEETYWDFCAQRRLSPGVADGAWPACAVHDASGAEWQDEDEGKAELFQEEADEGKIALLPLWLWAFLPWAKPDGMPRYVWWYLYMSAVDI